MMTGHGLVWVVAGTMVLVGSGVGLAEVKTVRPDGGVNRAAWMAKGSFGVMTHYLVSPKGATAGERTADLNRIVDRFDVDCYVKQFEATGADWLILTLAQGTGYLSSHNETIDRLEKGFTPKRELIPEISKALHARGKRVIIYLPGAYTGADPTVKRLLKLGTPGYAERHNAFIREYSLKLGKLCDGWWFDSCEPQTNAVWEAEMAACRAGNPESVVAFSGAEFCASGRIKPLCPIEDYHAGEIHLLEAGMIRTDFIYPPGENNIIVDENRNLRKKGQEPKFYMPNSQFIEGVQWHGLLPIDLTFNPAVPNQYCHYTDKELFKFVHDVKKVGGAITINVPIEIETGRIPEDTHSQLVRLGKWLRGEKEGTCGGKK